MKDLMFVSVTGFMVFLAGVLLLKREIRLFKNSVITKAIVVKYNSDNGMHRVTRYTMVAEYMLNDGKIVQSLEQASSNRQKYLIGTEIEINYSQERPDMFTVKGDYSRKTIMVGMIIVGLAMIIFGVLYLPR